MNCTWFVVMLLALLGCVWADEGSCPTGFAADSNRCVKDRPVHGTCPVGSNYQLNINKCVHA